eukprot:4813753-Lingulodinium_polyedra.AAC.2
MVGWRQRQQWAQERDRSRSPHRTGEHVLASWMLEWAWGKASASDVVRRAHAFVEDIGSRGVDERVLRLARTASNLGNAERVVSSVAPLDGMPDPIEIPGSSVQWVLEPFVLFQWMKATVMQKFVTHLGATPGGLEDWWAKLQSTPAGRDFWELHPWLRQRSPGDLKWHVPAMLFDDFGPVTSTRSTMARVWYSLVGVGSERETRFLLCTGMKGGSLPDLSWPVIMNSFEQLSRPVGAGDWGAVLLFVGCDLEYACNVLGLPHFNATGNCCADCMADTEGVPFNNFHGAAAWRDTLKTNTQYLAAVRTPMHPLLAHPWFCKYSYRHDLLHMIDHHGVASHVIGNILWAHICGERETSVIPGATLEERLAFLNADIRAYYSHCR